MVSKDRKATKASQGRTEFPEHRESSVQRAKKVREVRQELQL